MYCSGGLFVPIIPSLAFDDDLDPGQSTTARPDTVSPPRRDAGMELLCIMRAVTRPGSRSGPGIIINYGISRQLYQNLKSQ